MKLIGQVEHGSGRGRGIGFPTLNVSVRGLELEFGVYVGWVNFLSSEGASMGDVSLGTAVSSGEQKKYSAVMNWGGRPTFGETLPVLEIHLLEVSGDFYGRKVEVEFGPRLRGVRQFSSVETLKEQIADDVRRAQAFFRLGRLV